MLLRHVRNRTFALFVLYCKKRNLNTLMLALNNIYSACLARTPMSSGVHAIVARQFVTAVMFLQCFTVRIASMFSTIAPLQVSRLWLL